MKLAPVGALVILAALLSSQPMPFERVGRLPEGGFLLNSGWLLRPAGRQIPLDTLPMSTALSPDKRFLVVLNAGYNPPSLSVIDVATEKQIGRTRVPDGWLGLAFSPNGRLLYVGGGSTASVFEFTVSEEGALEASRTFEAVHPDDRTHRDFIGDIAITPDGRLIYAADLFNNQILVFNPQSGRVIDRFKTGRRPYRILFHPDGRSYFVTSWADGSIHHHETDNGNQLSMIRLGPHPTDMVWREKKTALEEGEEAPWRARLFIPAANTNKVYVLGVSESNTMRLVETINIAMTPRQPLGMTPSAVALNADESRLFVVCSDANAVAVADVSGQRSNVLGFIPTGWYPTAARSLPDGRLVVLNGRGLGSSSNPRGPNPTRRPSPLYGGVEAVQYVGRLQTGTASVIDAPNDEQLFGYSETVIKNTPYSDKKLEDAGAPPGSPVPKRPGEPSPIQHVVYVVKEGRTYDQIFGGLGIGKGMATLELFGEQVTPNHRKLAREFVLFDNFYVNSDVSADGHNWATAAIAPDYVQKMWPNSYGGRRRHDDYDGGDPASIPPAGYLWTNAAAARISFQNYGHFVTNRKGAGAGVQVESVRDPALARNTNMHYRGFDPGYPDIERAKVFIADLARFDSENSMPRLCLLRLGNDHTSELTPGKVSPRSAMADNDYALGLIVEACTRSKFWSKMAIFVLEADAQNGADHVDSHRSPAFVISPYARRGVVDSTMYNTTSMLRTMELILGLHPMTHFDAGATPMFAAFQSTPNAQQYAAERPRHALDERNPEPSGAATR